MKVFATHLPVLSRTESLLLLGQMQKAVDARSGGNWTILADLSASIGAGSSVLSFQASRTYAPPNHVLQLLCEYIPAGSEGAELRATFGDTGTWQTAQSEQAVGDAMSRLHNCLLALLGKPPSKAWHLTTGRWNTGTHFES